jgi:hypothetical protein
LDNFLGRYWLKCDFLEKLCVFFTLRPNHCAVTCHKGGGPGVACGSDCQYIGLTTRRAKVRWGEHKTSARPLFQSTSKPVGKHFQLNGHEVHDLKFVVIEHVRSKNPFVLKATESFWIQQYDVIKHGPNISE